LIIGAHESAAVCLQLPLRATNPVLELRGDIADGYEK
jgi:hypothetical protein